MDRAMLVEHLAQAARHVAGEISGLLSRWGLGLPRPSSVWQRLTPQRERRRIASWEGGSMVGRRVQRGFRRLGLIVAVPFLVVSAGAFAFACFAWINAPVDPALDYVAIIESPPGHIIFIDPPCDIRDTFGSPRAICAAGRSFWLLRVAGVTALIACVWYVACWSIGAVLAGFSRDVTVKPPT
jgi:hypothetical protein